MAFFVSLAVAFALQVIAYLIMPQPKPAKSPAAKDLESPTAEAGREIPVVFGTVTVKSINVLWFGDKSKSTYKVPA